MTKFNELLTHITHKHVYIQTHNFPDPDAMASACGLQKLLEYKGIESTICYSGNIDRSNTSKLVSLTNIELFNIDHLQCFSHDAEIILVDAQKGNSNIIDMTGNEIICIDHHPYSDCISKLNSEYRFHDIRTNVGACASIIASYFFENNIPIDTNTATLLCFAIKIDTKGLSRGMSRLDLDMFYKLFLLSDHSIINTLEHSILEYSDLKVYSDAIKNIKVVDNISFSNVGHNCPEALIASISDFMLQLKEVDFSVVYSYKRDGIKISVRSEASQFDAGLITKNALAGLGGGGGHQSMAGGFIPFENFTKLKKITLNETSDIIQKRFLNEIKLNKR